jgi:CheY-like chemotaxis protein
MTGAITGGAAGAPPGSVPPTRVPPTRVLLADDQELVRAGLRMMVDSAPDLTVVGEAATGRQAIKLAKQERADVVLMDIRMPELDGLAATRQITADETLAGVKILILTTFEVDEYVFEALRAGGDGHVQRGDSRPPHAQPADRQDARQPCDDQARCPRSRPARGLGLPGRAGGPAVSRPPRSLSEQTEPRHRSE